MGEAFIVRKGGGGGEPIPAPTITLVSKTDSSIIFTVTNNSIKQQNINYGLTTPPTTTTITLASEVVSANQTISGLTANTEVTIFAQASDSSIATLTVTTEPIIYTVATGGTTLEYNSNGTRYKSHTFTSSGTFTVSTVGNSERSLVDYLIIGGGGGGVFTTGGTAGQYKTTNGTNGNGLPLEPKVVVEEQNYSITIGLGGNQDISGASSSGLGITSNGGTAGGGNSHPGIANLLRTGLNESRAGGGGNAGSGACGSGGESGSAGGGTGEGRFGNCGTLSATSATANTGSGGGGKRFANGGNGGSGIVIIRYEIASI